MDAQEKKYLLRAKQYIQDKQYHKARALLSSIPQNPIAADWLKKLDQLSPTPAFASQAPAADATTATGLPARKPQPKLPHGKPWNPRNSWISSSFFVGGMFSSFVILMFLAFNWRRLGKPQWVMETILMGVLLLAGGITLLILLVTDVLLLPIEIGTVLVVACFVGIIIFTYYIMELQNGAYKKWAAGDIQGMLDHQYQFGSALGRPIVFLLVVVVVAGGFTYINNRDKSFENDLISLKYPSDYTEYDANWAEYCQAPDADETCFLTLMREDIAPILATSLVFSYWDSASPNTDITQAFTYHYESAEYEVSEQSRLMIDDINSYVIDSVYQSDDPQRLTAYVTRIYIPLEARVMAVDIWTESLDRHEERREDIFAFLQEDLDIK